MSNTASPFDAKSSMLGYIYQCCYALMFALQKAQQDPLGKIYIEKYDDIAFESEGAIQEILQTKHRLKSTVDLSNNSAALWKTLRIWSELVKSGEIDLESAAFNIITTGSISIKSVAYNLKVDNQRNPTTAHELLLNITESSKNDKNAVCYQAFRSLTTSQQIKLIEKIFIFPYAENLPTIQKQIMELLSLNVDRKNLRNLYENLEGWWLHKVINHLTEENRSPIEVGSLKKHILDIIHSYRLDNLPVYSDIKATPDEINTYKNRTFVKQLNIINLRDGRINYAIDDYHIAKHHRSKWLREEVLFIDELEKYDKKLTSEWGRKFELMKENLTENTDEQKLQAGRKLYEWSQDVSIPIRSREDNFISRGSFHELADKPTIGWHPDYSDIIKKENN